MLSSVSGAETAGFMIPVFDFDGAAKTQIALKEGEICVEYQNARCRYRFGGALDPQFRYYYNRNGRYRVYRVAAKMLRIEMEENIYGA